MHSLVVIISTILVLTAIILGLYYLNTRNSTASNSTPPAEKSKHGFDDVTKITIEDIDLMADGSDFELYIACILAELGYAGVYKTTGSRDYGADVVFIDHQGNQTVIQAKRYGVDNPVGLSAVQEAYTSKRYYKAKNAMVVTSSRYTDACETLAGVNHVLLIDRSQLITITEALRSGQYQKARDIFEAEPRAIHDSWTELKDTYKVVKKDKKADKIIYGS